MHISLSAETIFILLGFPITNSIIMTWMTMLLLIIFGVLAGRNPQMVPGKLQNLVEAILEFFIGLSDQILQDRKLTLKALPVVGTLFLLIVLSNWLGLLPGVGTYGIVETHGSETTIIPLLRPTNADVNSTLSFAIISLVVTQIFGVVAVGFASHTRKYFNFRSLFSMKFEGFIHFVVGLLEIISEFSRIISFSFRLYGNIFAGEVLLTVIAFLVPVIVPLPFYLLELFVGLIQGVVFVTLTLVFIKIATTDHDHSHTEAHGKARPLRVYGQTGVV